MCQLRAAHGSGNVPARCRGPTICTHRAPRSTRPCVSPSSRRNALTHTPVNRLRSCTEKTALTTGSTGSVSSGSSTPAARRPNVINARYAVRHR